MLAGYLMLQPKEGWDYLCGLLKDGKEGLLTRYSALRTIRFLWDQRPAVVEKPNLAAGAALALDHVDIADFAIEDLRKWQRWECCDRILGLFGKGDYDTSVMARSILRYALQCPNPRAAEFIRQQRRRDSRLIEEIEELLRLETETPGRQGGPGKAK